MGANVDIWCGSTDARRGLCWPPMRPVCMSWWLRCVWGVCDRGGLVAVGRAVVCAPGGRGHNGDWVAGFGLGVVDLSIIGEKADSKARFRLHVHMFRLNASLSAG